MPAPPERRTCPARAVALVHRSATATTTTAVGEPLVPECFDYRGAVLWNAHVPAALGPDLRTASTARWPGPAG